MNASSFSRGAVHPDKLHFGVKKHCGTPLIAHAYQQGGDIVRGKAVTHALDDMYDVGKLVFGQKDITEQHHAGVGGKAQLFQMQR